MNSQIAAQQPPTNAKVIIYTSHGQIDIELWTKQAPLASKNFIQLCMEGYYNNTIFHRLIPGFMIQGGDPSGTGMGGESIYGKGFADQFHQRLKFTRRGIVAMANSGKNTNGSQFFITFGACEHLNKKHTIFGKVVGDTIYNVMSLQSLDTGKDDLPLNPPIIRKTKIVENPFTDIKLRVDIKQDDNSTIKTGQQLLKAQREKKQKQQRAKLNKKAQLKKLKKKNKLTFDVEEDQEEIQTSTGATKGGRLKSSHDVLAGKDASLSNRQAISKQQIQKKRKQKQIQQMKAEQIKHALLAKEKLQQQNAQKQSYNQIINKQMAKKLKIHEKMKADGIKKEQVQYERRFNPQTNKYQIVFADQLQREKQQKQREAEIERKAHQEAQISDEKLRQVRQQQKNEYQLLKADELNFKKAKEGSLQQKRKNLIHQQKKLLSNLQKHRYQYMKKQKVEKHQGELFQKLLGFTKRLKGKEPLVKSESQNSKIVDNKWMNHQLKFHIDSGNAYSLEKKKALTGYTNEDDGGLKVQGQYYLQEQNRQEKDLLDSVYREVIKEEKNQSSNQIREEKEKLQINEMHQ